MIRLMLVDDHEVLRTGLKSYLSGFPEIQVVAEASSGVEALARATETQPDVVVMDLTMPDMDGMEATRRLKAQWPDCRVIALTVHEDKQYFFEMLGAGAAGYVTKRAAADELVSAIMAVSEGNVYLQPALARWLLEDYMRLLSKVPKVKQNRQAENVLEPGLEVLSSRERQVLELIAQGMTGPRIAEQLDLSPKTVARHRERIMHKLNLHSVAGLVKFAIRTGLIDLG